jgi:hypothetical protein
MAPGQPRQKKKIPKIPSQWKKVAWWQMLSFQNLRDLKEDLKFKASLARLCPKEKKKTEKELSHGLECHATDMRVRLTWEKYPVTPGIPRVNLLRNLDFNMKVMRS